MRGRRIFCIVAGVHNRGVGHDGGPLESIETGNQEVLVTISSVDFILEIGKELGEGGRGRESLKK
jgi:hypothetical protein